MALAEVVISGHRVLELFIHLYNDTQDADIGVLQQDPGIGDSALTGKSP